MSSEGASVADPNNKTGKRAILTANPAAAGSNVTPTLQRSSSAEESKSLYSYFLANITNEFRTPLAALNASLQYLLGDLENLSPDDIRELLQSIHLSVTGLQTLIDNLIESTNIEAGRFSIRMGAIDIRDVVADAADFTSPLFKRRGQQVIVEQPTSLPLIYGDPSRLGQVLVNMLSSASKLGSMNQTIYVELQRWDQERLRVSVSDQRPDAASEFARAPLNYPSPTAGSGEGPYSVELGLAVAKAIVEEHGGIFRVDQRPGGGSVYWFTVTTVEQR